MSLDAAAVREGDAHGLAVRRFRLLAGSEHEEDRLHFRVLDGLGVSAALRGERDLRLREVEVGDGPAPRLAGARVDRDALLAFDDYGRRRRHGNDTVRR